MRWVGIRTPRQIAEHLGWDSKDVMRRSRELLDEVDVLTIHQKKQKLLIDLQRISTEAEEAAATTVDEYKAGLYNSAVAAQKEVLKQLAALEKQDNEKIERLNALRIRELLNLMDRVVVGGCAALAERHGLSEEELMAEFRGRLVDEAQKMELE